MKNSILSALDKKAEKDSKLAVSGLSELFGIPDNVVVKEISVDKLRENTNHPFKVSDDTEMEKLVDSIEADGQIEPIIVRPLSDDYYEILAGHRRTRAHKILGKRTIKAMVGNFDDEKANRILINSNFNQRSVIYPSEIAKSYKLRYEDLKRLRKNSDHRNFENERKIDEILAEEFHMSKSSIYMYLHFNYLIDELLELLDEKKIKQKIADELSYLRAEEQEIVHKLVFVKKISVMNKAKASLLREESSKHELSEEDVINLLVSQSNTESKYKYFSKGQLEKYAVKFKSPQDMEKTIIQFLESYQ